MKKGNLSYASMFFANALIYGLTALYYNFIQIYIGGYHPDSITGILLAIGPLVSIFGPVVWGIFADKAKSKNTVLAVATVGSAVFYFALMLNQSFIYLAVMLAMCMFFMSPLGSLVDVITLEYATENGKQYGFLRVIGSVGFGLVAFVLSAFTEKNINIIFYAYVIMTVFSVVFVLSSPKIAGHGSEKKKLNIAHLFKDRKFLVLVFFVFISQFAWSYYLNFFPDHLINTLGQNHEIWGINVFLTLLGEIPFFLAFGKLFEKFSLKILLLVSLLSTVLRYICLAFITNVPMLLIIGCITGLSVTVFVYCATYYIGKYVAPEIKASANSLLYCVGYGIARVLASLLSGYMNTYLGYTNSMLVCTLLTLVGLVVFFFTFARYKLPDRNVQ